MHFPVSGVDCPLWLPPLVAFVISLFTSMGGVSGAFLLLPFQMSFLGFTSPAVSPTNLVFNIVAIPAGVWRYIREGRMVWPLTWVVVAGTLPGVIAGGFIRLKWLPDPGPFKVFVGCVLLYIGARLFWDLVAQRRKARAAQREKSPLLEGQPAAFVVEACRLSWRRLSFTFAGQDYACSTPGIFGLSLAVGMVGGVYGIGGGAIVAPFFVAVFGLPVHAVAGAALMGTFVTSIVGVAFYQAIAPWYAGQMAVAPDWLLGALFGLGGVAGMYCGARLQRLVKPSWLKLMLGIILLVVAVKYVGGYLLN
ncbi:MAG: sulfite exporter TauE/SafE family protein [Desulfarculaceae bacterium]|nr:sulfite exporter TauE/SafE family protein [Desulfarculaceae bacterium]MCF8073761.1 sulfite exporter TauE/SafE family protein [Desulfarculaceae bacterium]MCF8102002.1 sulfite exporter TauE/SafE family protein [Desulfarculaceae bacterium]MCF8115972.1 sulfite exporter TauE/SafE family protein [Desulfarculaceae bacterium]